MSMWLAMRDLEDEIVQGSNRTSRRLLEAGHGTERSPRDALLTPKNAKHAACHNGPDRLPRKDAEEGSRESGKAKSASWQVHVGKKTSGADMESFPT